MTKKTCCICLRVDADDAFTCPACGEASWSAPFEEVEEPPPPSSKDEDEDSGPESNPGPPPSFENLREPEVAPPKKRGRR